MKIEHKYDIKDYVMTKTGNIGYITDIKAQRGQPINYYIYLCNGNCQWFADSEILFKLNKENEETKEIDTKFDLGDIVEGDSGIHGVADSVSKNEFGISYYIKSAKVESWIIEDALSLA